jgi:hypothetical protein
MGCALAKPINSFTPRRRRWVSHGLNPSYGASFENMQRRVLQQDDGFRIHDAAV